MMGSINFSHVQNHPAAAPMASKLRLVEDRWAHEFVAAKRAKGLGWFAIAQMLGRCMLDVRTQFDPDFEPPFAANVVPITPASPAGGRRGQKGVRQERWRVPGVEPHSLEHRCLQLIEDGFYGCHQLGHELGKTAKAASNLIYILRAKGLVGGVSGSLSITKAGRAALEAVR